MNKPNAPKTSVSDTPTAEELSGTTALTPSRFIALLGRGARGKTWLARWLIERAQNAGRAVVVADADRTNATLSAYFDGVLTPPNADDADVHDWFVALTEQQIEERFTTLLDFGAGDLMLKRVAREIGLVPFFGAYGIEPVAIHLLGPDRDDLAYLRDVEEGGLFAPKATIIVLNEGLVPAGRSAKAAFGPVLDNPILNAALARGAKAIWMPRLIPAHEVDERRLTFAAAVAGRIKEGQRQIGPYNRELIKNWLRAMEQNFAPVAGWLP